MCSAGFGSNSMTRQLDLGAKPATRALDILRALVASKECTCSLEMLQDWLWPDLDGDQAKAACDQALHRLRKLLGRPDLVVQREGKLRLASEKVWVDLVDWEASLRQALRPAMPAEFAHPELERHFSDFAGPPMLNERIASWFLPVTERVRGQFIELACRVGSGRALLGDRDGAHAAYLRALDFYPNATRIYKALIESRLAQNDSIGAVADYSRYERTIRAIDDELPSPDIRAIVKPLLTRGVNFGL